MISDKSPAGGDYQLSIINYQLFIPYSLFIIPYYFFLIPSYLIINCCVIMKKAFISSVLSVLSVFIFSCQNNKKKEEKIEVPAQETVHVAEFNADSAYLFVKAQIEFGPRVPNTKAAANCGDYLIHKMKQWSDTVIVQKGTVTAYDGTKLKFRNIISSFNLESKPAFYYLHIGIRDHGLIRTMLIKTNPL